MISSRNHFGRSPNGMTLAILGTDVTKVKAGGPEDMMGIIGIAILVGLCAGGFALYSGSSILAAFGAYMLFGWLFILAAVLVLGAVKMLQSRIRKQDHAYSG